jgi:hypothetical protein
LQCWHSDGVPEHLPPKDCGKHEPKIRPHKVKKNCNKFSILNNTSAYLIIALHEEDQHISPGNPHYHYRCTDNLQMKKAQLIGKEIWK